MRRNSRRFFDPLYGEMYLSEKEYSLVMSPEIQRLRYVRLCNINSLLITGASEISRFEHVVGVLRLAKEWVGCQVNITSKEAEVFTSAALLHDFQTGPFGHSLQYVFEDNESDGEDFVHDDLDHGDAYRYHQITDENASFAGRRFETQGILGEKWDLVTSLIRGEGELGKLISGSMDLDNIDNVIRLAYHVGVANSEDADVALDLARNLVVEEGRLCCPKRTVVSVERWYQIRKRLYELLLLDWAEFSAKAMLTLAMELAIEGNLLGADTWLKTDLEFLSFLEKESIGEHQRIGNIIKRIRRGDLYFPLLLLKSKSLQHQEKYTSAESKRAMEKELHNLILAETGERCSPLIHPIVDCKKTERAISLRVLESGEDMVVGVDSRQLLIGVFFENSFSSAKKEFAIENLVREFLSVNGLEDQSDIADPLPAPGELQLGLL